MCRRNAKTVEKQAARIRSLEARVAALEARLADVEARTAGTLVLAAAAPPTPAQPPPPWLPSQPSGPVWIGPDTNTIRPRIICCDGATPGTAVPG